MIGNPKFNVGDKVRFIFDGVELKGTIVVVDGHGTYFDGTHVYYDIQSGNVLYKHINEDFIHED